MNDMSAAVSAALPLLEALFSLGVPGILLVLASIPALVVVVVFALDYKHGRRVAQVLEAYREDTQESLRVMTEKFEASLREMNRNHEEVAEYYRRNVSLVKNYERLTDALQTLVVNNTRAVEHLSTIVETRSKL
ncbi:transcriptional regulator [uncultured Desulfovibrio sp.]|uniref:transcriptional regulator n=1 Tax=uncultured Desulfovibrio sp. TaxID=167968 RepID=UPI001F93ACE1|nr:transcriptional regulator [uncultured Desulfovibrio sp.]HJA77389.1 transcriptional regulator [Candidatus Desulfovibrio gallistercoris]